MATTADAHPVAESDPLGLARAADNALRRGGARVSIPGST